MPSPALRSKLALALLSLLTLAGCAEAPTIPQVHPLPEGRLSSGYGARTVDPVSGEVKANGHHGGYDLAAAMGTPIRASKAGKVTFAGRKGGYGNAVILAHSGGYSTLYGHASRLAVKPGDRVDAGQVVAYVGSTGHSTGPHLHYELRYQGKPVDPGLFAAVKLPPRRERAETALASEPRKPAAPPRPVATPQSLPEDAPPLHYPADPEMLTAMQALDGAPLAAAEPAPPPTFWQRVKTWVSTVAQRVAALMMQRRST